jgi:hypothetical protein
VMERLAVATRAFFALASGGGTGGEVGDSMGRNTTAARCLPTISSTGSRVGCRLLALLPHQVAASFLSTCCSVPLIGRRCKNFVMN